MPVLAARLARWTRFCTGVPQSRYEVTERHRSVTEGRTSDGASNPREWVITSTSSSDDSMLVVATRASVPCHGGRNGASSSR